MNRGAEKLPRGCRGTPFRVTLAVIAAAGFATALVVPGDPGPVRARNGAAAQATLETIAAAQAGFRREHGRYGTLTELAAAGRIAPVIAERGAQGYAFSLAQLGSNTFTARAEPAVPGKSGTRWFERTDTGETREGESE